MKRSIPRGAPLEERIVEDGKSHRVLALVIDRFTGTGGIRLVSNFETRHGRNTRH